MTRLHWEKQRNRQATEARYANGGRCFQPATDAQLRYLEALVRQAGELPARVIPSPLNRAYASQLIKVWLRRVER